jgi:hypothetical protein
MTGWLETVWTAAQWVVVASCVASGVVLACMACAALYLARAERRAAHEPELVRAGVRSAAEPAQHP